MKHEQNSIQSVRCVCSHLTWRSFLKQVAPMGTPCNFLHLDASHAFDPVYLAALPAALKVSRPLEEFADAHVMPTARGDHLLVVLPAADLRCPRSSRPILSAFARLTCGSAAPKGNAPGAAPGGRSLHRLPLSPLQICSSHAAPRKRTWC